MMNQNSNMQKSRGRFITFEGVEGGGKSTQAKLLADALRNEYDVLLTREPGGPPVAEKIRALLLDPANDRLTPRAELLLYLASRSQHTGEWIIPALKRGAWVICDRYTDSTTAYQGAARKQSGGHLHTLQMFAAHDLVPDITILIDLPVEQGLERLKGRKADRIEQEGIEFHRAVRQAYLDVAKKEPARFIIIDGTLTIDRQRESILRQIRRRLIKE